MMTNAKERKNVAIKNITDILLDMVTVIISAKTRVAGALISILSII